MVISNQMAELSLRGTCSGSSASPGPCQSQLTLDSFTAHPRRLIHSSPSPSHSQVLVLDNLAVAHRASPLARDAAAGLRILHRTTVGSCRFDC